MTAAHRSPRKPGCYQCLDSKASVIEFSGSLCSRVSKSAEDVGKPHRAARVAEPFPLSMTQGVRPEIFPRPTDEPDGTKSAPASLGRSSRGIEADPQKGVERCGLRDQEQSSGEPSAAGPL